MISNLCLDNIYQTEFYNKREMIKPSIYQNYLLCHTSEFQHLQISISKDVFLVISVTNSNRLISINIIFL